MRDIPLNYAPGADLPSAPCPAPRAGKLPAGWERNKEKPAAWIFSTVKRFLAIITPPVAAAFVRLREVRPDVVDNLDDQVIEYIINLGPSRCGGTRVSMAAWCVLALGSRLYHCMP